jgi:DNA-directed RNA polymerase specialized sigma24 family protein
VTKFLGFPYLLRGFHLVRGKTVKQLPRVTAANRNRLRPHEPSDSGAEDSEEFWSLQKCIDAYLQKKNRAELLRRSLARLSPKHGEVIDLVYFHG